MTPNGFVPCLGLWIAITVLALFVGVPLAFADVFGFAFMARDPRSVERFQEWLMHRVEVVGGVE
jgi:hypothetical protein